MGKNTNILFDLIDIWAIQNQFYSVMGTVQSVSGRTCVVAPNDGGPDLLDVALEADFEDAESKGFFVVPAIGSNVIVTFKSKDYGFLSAYTEIDSIVAKQGAWIFNDGANDGLVKVNELTDKLNAVENKVNSLITYINTHIHPTTGIGSPTTPPQPGFTGGTLTPTQKAQIENENVKH